MSFLIGLIINSVNGIMIINEKRGVKIFWIVVGNSLFSIGFKYDNI